MRLYISYAGILPIHVPMYTALLNAQAILSEPGHNDRNRAVEPRKTLFIVDLRMRNVPSGMRMRLANKHKGRTCDHSDRCGVRFDRRPYASVICICVGYDQRGYDGCVAAFDSKPIHNPF